MHGAECEQSFRIGGTIFGDPVVYFGGEADYVWAYVVDQAGALDFGGVHEFQEFGGAGSVFFHLIVIAAAAFDQFQRGGSDHTVRVDVNVNVNNRRQFRVLQIPTIITMLCGFLQIDSLQAVDFLLVEAQDYAAAGYDYGAANQIWFAYHHADGLGAGGRMFFHFSLPGPPVAQGEIAGTSRSCPPAWIGPIAVGANGAMRPRRGCACHDGRRTPPGPHFPGAANSREFRPGESAPTQRCGPYRIPTVRARRRKELWVRGRADPSLRAA